MRKLLFSLLLLVATPAFAADRYEFDKSHTNILFFISHVGFSQMVGIFTDYDGYFTFDPNKPAESTIDVTIKPTGIRTSSTALDAHLQKPEFFNTEKFPEIKFVSTGIQVTGAKTGVVTGNVTLLGITKPVALKVTFNKGDYHPITQDFIAGFSAEATLKRSDFGMTNGIPMVGDEVKIMIETEGVNADLKKKMEKKS
jgi:polyisoprenoid-binding protein YceI